MRFRKKFGRGYKSSKYGVRKLRRGKRLRKYGVSRGGVRL